MNTVTEATTLCSKCKVKPRVDADSTNPWCTDCKTKYQKEYKEMALKRSSERAYIAGIEAMRQTLVAEFSRLGRAVLSGKEVAFAITNAPRPPLVLRSED